MYEKITLNICFIVSMMLIQIKGLSFNQPKFCSSATWDPNGITFPTATSGTESVTAIFVDTNNTIYAVDTMLNYIPVWSEGNLIPVRNISNYANISSSIFVGNNGDVYVDGFNRTIKWAANATNSVTAMYVEGSCYSLFVDIQENIYCCMGGVEKVIRKLSNDSPNTTMIVAGTGIRGATSTTLHNPRGIFVDKQFNLYVADCGNNRVQLFPPGQSSARTVAGANASDTITLICPSAVILDADGYLFIVDTGNNRIVASSFNEFRCLVGCTRASGPASNQLNSPRRMLFDSHGNFFVIDRLNSRIQKFLLATNSCGPSYNQPKFCSSARWNPNATTIADASIVGQKPWGVFVDVNNTIYVADKQQHAIRIQKEGWVTSWKNISGDLFVPFGIFVALNGDIYVDNGKNRGRVDMWTLNSTASVAVMDVNASCSGLFIDFHDNLYCSSGDLDQVIRKQLNNPSNITIVVAGNGAPGLAPNLLRNPQGIFVDNKLNLYVADCGNDRIQRFAFGELNGTTVAGQGVPGTVTLRCPAGIILDGDGYLFITDYFNNRIIRSGPNGLQCIAGCSGVNGSAADELHLPRSLNFDSYGNIFVVDGLNDRIQKFWLDTSLCDQSTTTDIQSTELSTLSAQTSFTIPQSSFSFIPPICPNRMMFGINCNISNNLCDMSKPCQNNGICHNNDTQNHGYTCSCSSGFNGTQCQFDHRPCQSNTCWNGGICNETSNTEYQCSCSVGWEGSHCQNLINYCADVSCLNNGVCHSSLMNYTCECLADSYSGLHCEITSNRIVIYQTISKSIGYIAILVIISAATFIVIMDLLKYCFGINPTRAQRKNIPSKRKAPVIIQYKYIHLLMPPKAVETSNQSKV